MGKKKDKAGGERRRPPELPEIDKKDYKREIHALWIELVKLQRHLIAGNGRLLVLIEGRDGAGKDAAIKTIVRHLSPREVRIVALPKPTERDKSQWYFQRWVAHLPAADEIVLYNRSWYNRAGVERVMGFCTDEEHEEFLQQVPLFEEMLVRSGIRLCKYYLDITHAEQEKQLAERREDPLKQWKISPIDAVALEHWDDYSQARDLMLSRTHTAAAPWTIVRADDRRVAQLNLIRDLLRRNPYEGRDEERLVPDPRVVFPFGPEYIENGMIAP